MNPAPRPDAHEAAALARACRLARQGEGDVEPNPMVGAVLLADGRSVSEGWHVHFGGPHAEIDALARAGGRAKDATLCVSLEPCSTSGKTGPCTDALLAAGVARVVAGCIDPNPAHAGRGLELLCRAGLEAVDANLPEARALLGCRASTRPQGRPHVLLKWAMSSDGAIAPASRVPTRLSDEPSLDRVHRWRAHADAVLVGVGTVLADDPLLTTRRGFTPVRPGVRVVLDPELRMPQGAQLVSSATRWPTWIFTTDGAAPGAAGPLELAGVRVLRLPAGPSWLRSVFRTLDGEGVDRVLVEGGARTLGACLADGLADQVAVFCTSRELGPGALPALPDVHLGGLGPGQLAEVLGLSGARSERSGADVLVRGWLEA